MSRQRLASYILFAVFSGESLADTQICRYVEFGCVYVECVCKWWCLYVYEYVECVWCVFVCVYVEYVCTFMCKYVCMLCVCMECVWCVCMWCMFVYT